MDNHESHITIAAVAYCKENGVVLLTFPPHCSHKLQPLDRGVYGPLKSYFNHEASLVSAHESEFAPSEVTDRALPVETIETTAPVTAPSTPETKQAPHRQRHRHHQKRHHPVQPDLKKKRHIFFLKLSARSQNHR